MLGTKQWLSRLVRLKRRAGQETPKAWVSQFVFLGKVCESFGKQPGKAYCGFHLFYWYSYWYQSLLGQTTVVHRIRWCMRKLEWLQCEWRRLSSSPPPSPKQQEVPCNPRCLQLWPHCCRMSQDVENRSTQSDFGTLKLRPVLTGLLSNGKLGRKLLRTLGTCFESCEACAKLPNSCSYSTCSTSASRRKHTCCAVRCRKGRCDFLHWDIQARKTGKDGRMNCNNDQERTCSQSRLMTGT